GYLALFLGTLGLAIVLLRNLLERRAELAMLAALGFTPGRRLALILLENAWLLLLGVAIGLLSALPALGPTWSQVHLSNLLAPLALVLGGGLLTLTLVTWLSLNFAGRLQVREE
ncbi:MAG: FtsX-like permease family protein, partial [Phycisphaerae bacterium]